MSIDSKTRNNLEQLIAKLPEVYQSIYVKGELIREGVRGNEFERLEVIKNYIKPGQTILDVGSNVGFFTINLAKLFPENVFVSVENQYSYARLQQELIELEGVTNVILINSTMSTDWLIKAAQACAYFDTTLLLSILHHIPDAENFLTQLGQVSKSFIIELPHPDESKVCGKDIIRKQLTVEKIGRVKPVFIKMPYEATTHCDASLKRSFYYADSPEYERQSIYPYIGFPEAPRNYHIKANNDEGLIIYKTRIDQDIKAIPGVLLYDIAKIGPIFSPSYETCIKQIECEIDRLENIENVGDLRPWNILFTASGLKFIDYQDVNNLDNNLNFIQKDLMFDRNKDFEITKKYLTSILLKKTSSSKIALDISVLGLGYIQKIARTGVFRVTENILKGLIYSSEFEVSLCSSIPELSSACQNYLKNEFEYLHLPLFEISQLRTLGISAYHSTFYPVPTEINFCSKIITIYDLIPIKFPELFESKSDFMIANCLKSITKNDFIACISEATKRDILEYQNLIVDSQVKVTHLAADESKFYCCQDPSLIYNIRQKYRIGEFSYLLSVCTLEPRKNIAHVIRCFVRLIETKQISDLNLVLVGTKGWQYDEIFEELDRHVNLRERIIFTDFVPDEDLAPLYSDALAFVYLSLYEGFGLPPLEAMQCGTPVITSNTSSLPEVIGEAGIMLSPDDTDGLCDAMFELYTKQDLRDLLSLQSLEQSKEFNWKKTLKETIEIYKLAVEHQFLPPYPTIIVDGVFFQLYDTGIARVWKSLLEEWAKSGFAKHIILLDRVGTAPRISGIRYRTIPAYDYGNTDRDRAMLQQICDEEGADVFISSYYTTPIDTPSVFMTYDMIPEVMGWNLNELMWQEKHQGIQHASSYITISEHTAQDLTKCFRNITSESVTVAHCGVSSIFVPAQPEAVNTFKTKYGITKPYFVLVGAGGGYKNSPLFFQAFNQLATSCGFDIICTGSSNLLSADLRACTAGSAVHMLQLSDEELALAYSGAVALVYPSKYEGFGMPIAEAMACGCPVITCPNASIPEVAGDAAIYVNDDDINSMAAALCEVQKPQIRAALISKGLAQSQKFSWSQMADTVKSVLIEQTLDHLPLNEQNLIIFPDWSQDEEELGEEIASVCYNLAQSSEFNRPTLLIDTTNAEDIESVNMLISGIAMNLMMGVDIDITEHLEIALTGDLATIQWQALLPKLHGRIKLELEDSRSIESSGANLIREIQLTETLALALV
jgi:glycosyltransferase involved in cell wall biosynthesis